MLAVRPKGEETGDGERCWVNVRSADASYKQASGGLWASSEHRAVV